MIPHAKKALSLNENIWLVRQAHFRANGRRTSYPDKLIPTADTRPPAIRAEEQFRRGHDAEQENDTIKAFEHYRKAIELYPRHYQARTNLGCLLLKAGPGHIGAAMDHFYLALRDAEQLPRAAFNLGCAFELIGNSRAAEKYYRLAIKWAPDYPDANFNLAALLREQAEILDDKIKLWSAIYYFRQYLRATRNQKDDIHRGVAQENVRIHSAWARRTLVTSLPQNLSIAV